MKLSKEEEWQLIKEVQNQEQIFLEECWQVSWVVETLRQRQQKIRLNMVEKLITRRDERADSELQQIEKAAQILANMEIERWRIVRSAEDMLPNLIAAYIQDAEIDLTTEELLPLGEKALYRAARVLDSTRGLAYRTYARWWIKAVFERYEERKKSGTHRDNVDTSYRLVQLPK